MQDQPFQKLSVRAHHEKIHFDSEALFDMKVLCCVWACVCEWMCVYRFVCVWEALRRLSIYGHACVCCVGVCVCYDTEEKRSRIECTFMTSVRARRRTALCVLGHIYNPCMRRKWSYRLSVCTHVILRAWREKYNLDFRQKLLLAPFLIKESIRTQKTHYHPVNRKSSIFEGNVCYGKRHLPHVFKPRNLSECL